MLTTLSLPALAFLISFPGFGLRHSREAFPADTLPPPWKPVSRLMLENQFVFSALPDLRRGPVGLKLTYDPRQLHVSVDPDSGTLRSVTEMGEVTLGRGSQRPLATFAEELGRRNFQRAWLERSRTSVNSLGSATPGSGASGGGLSFQFPSPLPRRVQSLLGPGGPALNVSGQENIRLSGTSNWTNVQTGPLGQKPSLFPSLDMQQDLDIRLEGQLSDRIRVNLLQNSGVQIPLANRIAINYKGDEDDLIQALDLGNTNLSLPGTQYVSYSGKNEGLFGAKVSSRFGPLDFTMLASKQEGRSERASYAGGSSRQPQTLRDIDYIHNIYFLLYDPNGPAYDIPDSSIRVYFDDANYGNDNTATVRGRALIDPLQIETADTADSVSLGKGLVSVRGTFQLLDKGPDQDYEIISDYYGPNYKVLRMRHDVLGEQRLAVTYSRRPAGSTGPYELVGGQDRPDLDGVTARTMKLVRPPFSYFKPDAAGNYDTTLAIYPARELELKNFYRLGGQGIDLSTFKISIRRGRDDPPKTFFKAGGDTSVPFIEIVGLDSFDETTGLPVRAHDGLLDKTYFSTRANRLFVDPQEGVLWLPDPRPFAPRLGPGGKFFENLIDSELLRRARLTGPSDQDNAPNPAIYDKFNVQPDVDYTFLIDVEYSASRAGSEISLGRGSVLEGSDVVTVNGVSWVRDRDYSIDYDLGRITLKKQLLPTDQLNIDYSYAPLFQQAGRTLIGSAFRLEGRERSIGGAFMYESKGAQDLRPRLGEEPSRSLIADLNTAYAFRPDWITRVVDALPGIRTTAPSDFKVEAEIGASFPNPNTRNEVYIDDMEGVRDAVSLSMSADRWRLSSVPSRPDPGAIDPAGKVSSSKTLLELQAAQERIHNAELHWYSPYSVIKERELKPTLTQAQGADNSRQVLALSIPRRPTTARNDPADYDSLWAGLTYPLDAAGIDLSKSQFIELWVNDFNDRHDPDHPGPRVRGRHVRLHVDLGVVSEDQMRSPDVAPNRLFDTEDKEPRDGQLVVTDANNEDTGYDGILDDAEKSAIAAPYRDLVTAGPEDPQGDDFHGTNDAFKEIDPRRFVNTNGTEDNRTLIPVPDSEDLNNSFTLDAQEDYFEYTIDLGDENHPYLVTDLQKDYPNQINPNVPLDNGWRRYRIPIADTLRLQYGTPNLQTGMRAVRVWVEGITRVDPSPDSLSAPQDDPQRPLLMLGSLDIVGSRWRAVDLRPEQTALGATITLNSVNSQDNAEKYTPPFDPGETRSGSQGLTRREQSIAMEFTRLQPADTLEAFKTFSIDENYSRYGKLSWYATSFGVQDSLGSGAATGLEYFVRFSSDERGASYYEFRAPLPVGATPRTIVWKRVDLDLTELSGLKLDTVYTNRANLNEPYIVPRPGHPGESLVVLGRPSFTRLRRVSFGLVNLDAAAVQSGELWFDELRATDVAKDRGTAERVLVSGQLANLMGYSFAWNGNDADFLRVGENRGSGFSNSSFAAGTSIQLHRFFEGTGIVLPVQFNFTQNGSRPRFSAGDDVVRTDADASASETFSDSRNWSVGYSRTWSERSNALLRYTLGGITANVATQNTHAHTPSNLEITRSLGASVNYGIAPRTLLAIPMFGKAKLYPLPDRFYWNYRYDRRRAEASDRLSVTDPLVPRIPVDGRASTLNFGADTHPFDFIGHHFEAVRNMELKSGIQGLDWLGRVVTWNQRFDARYTLNRGTWLRPAFTWNSRYTQDNRPELSPNRDLSVRSITNGQSVTGHWDLPFEGLGSRAIASRDSTRKAPRGRLARDLFSRLGTISTDASINWSSAYSRTVGVPNFLYLVGLADDPGFADRRVVTTEGNQASKAFDYRAAARSRVAVGFGATVQTSAEVSSQISNQNDAERRRDVVRFPDLQFEYGRMTALLRIDKFLQNPRLRTSYNRSQTTDYNYGRTVKSGIATTSQWQPMLGLTGDFKNGTRFDLSVERRNTKSESFQLGHSTQTDRNTDVNFSLNRSYTQGQKVSLLGKETTVRSSISLGFDAAYSLQSGETRQDQVSGVRNPVKRDRLSTNVNGSYGFSSNVTGNLTLGFGQERDLQRDFIRRNIRVELRASFRF